MSALPNRIAVEISVASAFMAWGRGIYARHKTGRVAWAGASAEFAALYVEQMRPVWDLATQTFFADKDLTLSAIRSDTSGDTWLTRQATEVASRLCHRLGDELRYQPPENVLLRVSRWWGMAATEVTAVQTAACFHAVRSPIHEAVIPPGMVAYWVTAMGPTPKGNPVCDFCEALHLEPADRWAKVHPEQAEWITGGPPGHPWCRCHVEFFPVGVDPVDLYAMPQIGSSPAREPELDKPAIQQDIDPRETNPSKPNKTRNPRSKRPVVASGRKYQLHPAAQDPDVEYKLIVVSTDELSRAWGTGAGNFNYLPPHDTSQDIDDRRADFLDWERRNPQTPIQAPQVFIGDASGAIQFGDGRHRFRAIADSGAKTIAITVPKDDEAEIRRQLRTAGRK